MMDASRRKELRRILKHRRDNIPAAKRSQASLLVCEGLTGLPCYAGAARIGAYLAHRSELDPTPILNQAFALGKKLYIPRIVDDKKMIFVSWGPSMEMRRNRFGILEPKICRSVDIRLLDLVLVPLLGFDSKGNRLGSGAGYYDRSFYFKKDYPESLPLLIGLAYEEQAQICLPNEPWDIPLDYVITDARQIKIRR